MSHTLPLGLQKRPVHVGVRNSGLKFQKLWLQPGTKSLQRVWQVMGGGKGIRVVVVVVVFGVEVVVVVVVVGPAVVVVEVRGRIWQLIAEVVSTSQFELFGW